MHVLQLQPLEGIVSERSDLVRWSCTTVTGWHRPNDLVILGSVKDLSAEAFRGVDTALLTHLGVFDAGEGLTAGALVVTHPHRLFVANLVGYDLCFFEDRAEVAGFARAKVFRSHLATPGCVAMLPKTRTALGASKGVSLRSGDGHLAAVDESSGIRHASVLLRKG
jgi:hypothetical protein